MLVSCVLGKGVDEIANVNEEGKGSVIQTFFEQVRVAGGVS